MEYPPFFDPGNETTDNNLPILINAGRNIAMPSECTANPLQRALADSIIRMVSLDELRILFACGAKVSELRNLNLNLNRNFILGQRTSHTRSLRLALRRLAEEHRRN